VELLVALFHGALLAIGLILPLGVQNVFVFNQGASQTSYIRALPVIVTAALCDTFLIILAVSGVSLLILQIVWFKSVVLLLGSIFLIYMGWSIWRSHESDFSNNYKSMSSKEQITFALSVSLLNPHAIIDTIGVIGTSSLVYVGTEKYLFTLGCLAISWMWFFLLALVGRVVGKVDSTKVWQRRINILSALIIWGIACLLIYQLIAE
jgi:L-lysine exporter family protein LysE/ArgO